MADVPQFRPLWMTNQRVRRDRPNSYKRGYDRKWRKCRDAYLAAHPMCQEPGCNKFATEVDHKIALEEGGAKFDWNNLCGYCKRHHTQKTNRVDGGFGRQRRSDS